MSAAVPGEVRNPRPRVVRLPVSALRRTRRRMLSRTRANWAGPPPWVRRKTSGVAASRLTRSQTQPPSRTSAAAAGSAWALVMKPKSSPSSAA
ncbi:MAG: hypothetical protein A3J82_04420 [Elusimicrobia bacterium RIFOXYA2_FULL_69_6]|nr:MAG: hypothetical protein A3J82_04420 [Elusimicrobia bacterium RIFOXYA2_FULL_69_6]